MLFFATFAASREPKRSSSKPPNNSPRNPCHRISSRHPTKSQINYLSPQFVTAGHAVIVLDVAINTAGKRIALLGQEFMPAQELHVLRDTHHQVINNVWFILPDQSSQRLRTPSWAPFSANHARRFTPKP